MVKPPKTDKKPWEKTLNMAKNGETVLVNMVKNQIKSIIELCMDS
jgi:hypothetical protein